MAITRRAVEIRGVTDATVITESIAMPAAGEVLLTAEFGAISLGSESLVYRGKVPAELSLDDSIAALDGGVAYPVRYGYTVAGRVSHCGPGVDTERWLGRRAFAFHPHASHLVVPVDALLPIPDSVSTAAAPLYANVETALTLNWDAAVLPGETVLVLGLGVVGVLTAAIAARSGAGLVVAVDSDLARRAHAAAFLGDAVTVCADDGVEAALTGYPGTCRGDYSGFDVVFELSGQPEVLNTAVRWSAFGARIIAGSWYGTKAGDIALGGRFHRGRMQIISSQVSTLPVHLSGRFDRARRTAIAWDMLSRLPLEALPQRVIGLHDVPDILAAATSTPATGSLQAPREPWIVINYAQGASP
ncbi:MAG: zinc-binding alcohol dehydrogenase [Spirochaeta sp.]|jgi:2-desacetyl-2-hydroxyethyl bacteriochlorophyllide A dehydrogenase|nr:zinc-binding alcohol dehydrogenase [Spirochaeta sp.]